MRKNTIRRKDIERLSYRPVSYTVYLNKRGETDDRFHLSFDICYDCRFEDEGSEE